jgi:hypothetical protein
MGAKAIGRVVELLAVWKAFASVAAVVHYTATSDCVGKKVFAMIVIGELLV